MCVRASEFIEFLMCIFMDKTFGGLQLRIRLIGVWWGVLIEWAEIIGLEVGLDAKIVGTDNEEILQAL